MQKIQRIHFDKLDSTHLWVKAHYQEFDVGTLSCVTASVQTAGQGRLSRPWVSHRGNLHMTLFYELSKDNPHIPNLAQLMALAICSLFPTQIKWPNDLVVDRKKLGGILVELVDRGEQYGVIHSLGLNVNATVRTNQATTSLLEWMGKEHDLDALINPIVGAFFKQLEKGFSAKQFNAKLAYKGERIKVEQIEGVLLGVAKDGRLQIQQNNGKIVTISSGDLMPYQE